MRSVERMIRSNPLAVLAIVAIVGWALGSGLIPLRLPALGGLGGHATTAAPAKGAAAAPIAPATTIPTSSASMPAPAAPVADPFAGYMV